MHLEQYKFLYLELEQVLLYKNYKINLRRKTAFGLGHRTSA